MNTKFLKIIIFSLLNTLLLSGCVQTTGVVSQPSDSKVVTPLTSPSTLSSSMASQSSIQSIPTSTTNIQTSPTPTIEEYSAFVLCSSEVTEGGILPVDYTCDGTSATLPLEWSGAPAKTQSFALVMYTIPGPNESHWYWVLYNIPANVTQLEKNATGIGTLGNNSVNRNLEYAPPCSKGPGAKLYTYTLFALSAPPQFTVPAAQVSRDILLSAIQDRTLASAELNVYYSR
jgi:phosphatidylethanolamine-binding protein (PEBP) family uncharacterized protein